MIDETTPNRRQVLTNIAAAAAALAVPGAAMAQKKPFEGTTLNVACIKWDFMETLFGRYAKPIADELGINLQVSWYTYDGHRNKIVQDVMANATTWDIVYVDGKQVPEFANIHALEQLEPLIAKTKLDFGLNDFFKTALDHSKVDGKLYSIPLLADPNGLVYRKDLFAHAGERAAFKAKHGYDLGVPQTYKQFMDIAQFFTRKTGEKLAGETLTADFYGASHSNKAGDFLWHDYISYMEAFGGRLYDPKTMVPTWNSPENKAAGKYYVELGKTLPPGHVNMTSGESMTQFDKGRVAMIIEFYSRTLFLGDPKNSSIAGKFDYALLPTEKPQFPHATIVSMNSIGVYSKSKNKEAAATMLQRLTSKQVALQWAVHEPDSLFRAGNPLFPKASVFNDERVLKKFPALKLVAHTLEGKDVDAFDHPRLPEYAEAIDICANSLSQAFAGKPVDATFDEAQAKMVQLFKRSGYVK
ncbi:MAG TPA: sugar ABC transporter substrate-binding protein [Ramlibacter sp.]|uniref:ABC transporter substrate-binding protein n=1 Tax=Ramlibacter sp. TaxID=1917967 RepID=UPI002B938288|nr:sugar ABC transporter substrate-binding protein [Ramlibacter sp.]HVZ43532.1 sugar ABC transporter substrate-binding protein [Ramlibacter sp.]